MKRMKVDLGEHSYSILFSDSFQGLGEELRQLGTHPKIMAVTEPNIRRLYGQALERELADYQLIWHEIPGGEECKTLETVSGIYQALMEHRFDRKGTLLALGGGIVGDITGFAASSFMRGIDFVQVPTTLLAQVDSSVGGKTGVNFHYVKNIVGAFYQPKLVFANLSTLKTLSQRDYASGLGEVAKYGVLEGESLLSLLLEKAPDILRREKRVMGDIVALCCESKARIVSADEREQGLRAVLNLGHTFAHAYETATRHSIYHGEAVAMGLLSACKTAEQMGLFHETDRVKELLTALGLPDRLPECSREETEAAMQGDKKQEDGRLRFVLPYGLGDVRVTEQVPREAVACGLEAVWKR